jgi:nitroimidazol reductase NimA-like FMN-containing flavoprotein (pyridoxamine 5'-phosphate oxidase superfamily)
MCYEEKSLIALSRRECVDLLSTAQVGRAVFSERALPAVVAVTFGVHEGAVVMNTSRDSRLAAAARHGVLAFEVDDIDPVSRTGWSVVVIGEPELVTHAEECARIHLVVEPWAPGHHDVCIRLPLSVVTGRRIVVTDNAPAVRVP